MVTRCERINSQKLGALRLMSRMCINTRTRRIDNFLARMHAGAKAEILTETVARSYEWEVAARYLFSGA